MYTIYMGKINSGDLHCSNPAIPKELFLSLLAFGRWSGVGGGGWAVAAG